MPIGRDGRGLVLLDLEAAGVTSLLGTPEDVAPVMAWIVTELALASWPDYLHVTLVGFGDRLASLDPERVEAVGALDAARLSALAAQVTGANAVGAGAVDDPLLTGRITPRGGEASMPEVLVLSGGPDQESGRNVLRAVSGGKRMALAVLVAGPCPEAHVRLQVRPDHAIEVPTLGLTLQATASRIRPLRCCWCKGVSTKSPAGGAGLQVDTPLHAHIHPLFGPRAPGTGTGDRTGGRPETFGALGSTRVLPPCCRGTRRRRGHPRTALSRRCPDRPCGMGSGWLSCEPRA